MNNSKILKLNSVAKNVLKNYIEASKSSEMGVARVEIIPIQEIQLVENNPNKHKSNLFPRRLQIFHISQYY